MATSFPAKTKEQYISEILTAWLSPLGLQGGLEEGDPFLALTEAITTQLLFLQARAVSILKFARSSTAEDEDLDSFMAQFFLDRLPALYAKGPVQFSIKAVKQTDLLIPVGTIIQNQGGKIKYEVVADPLRPAFVAAKNAYVLVAGSKTVIVTAQALNNGAQSNIQPGQLTQLSGSTAPGIDAVKNLEVIANGADKESDAAYRERFQIDLNSKSRAIRTAILSAAKSVQVGLDVKIVSNKDITQAIRKAYFCVVVDDGTGNPTDLLISKVNSAVDLVKGLGVDHDIFKPTVLSATAALNIKIAPEADTNGVLLAVQDAVLAHINGLKIGDTLYIYDLIAVAKSASIYVRAVQVNSVKVNNVEADLSANEFQVIRSAVNQVSIGIWA